MLYIYLMFNSILVLGCVGLFVASEYGLPHKLVLSALCVVGLVIGISWIVMALDYAAASDLYSEIAKEAEKSMPEKLQPLTKRAEQRRKKAFIGTSRFVAVTTPGLFIGVYVVLLALAWCRPNTALERPGRQVELPEIEVRVATSHSTLRR